MGVEEDKIWEVGDDMVGVSDKLMSGVRFIYIIVLLYFEHV